MIPKLVKINIDIEDEYTKTVLQHACSYPERLEIVKFLVEKEGAYIYESKSEYSSSALKVACESKNIEAATFLFKKYDKEIQDKYLVGRYDVHKFLVLAAVCKKQELVKYLLEKDVPWTRNVNYDDTPLHKAAGNGDLEMFNLILKFTIFGQENCKLLKNEDYRHLQELIFSACKGGNIDIIKCVLAKGGDKYINSGEFNHQYEAPWSVACNKGNLEILKLLLENKAKINKEDTTRVLENACRRGDAEVVEFLVENGVNINTTYRSGGTVNGEHSYSTPLEEACESKSLKTVKFLVERGAKINLKSIENARNSESLEVFKYLMEQDHDVDIHSKKYSNGADAFLGYTCYGSDYLEIAKYLVFEYKKSYLYKEIDFYNVLSFFANKGDLELVTHFVESKKLDLEVFSNTEIKEYNQMNHLSFPCSKGSYDIVKYLIEVKSGVNAVHNYDHHIHNRSYYSPLTAVTHAKDNSLKMLSYF